METLFARYFDGDLDDHEAQEFLDAIAANPKLESELRAYEQVLAIGKAAQNPALPIEFTERVMADLKIEARRRRTWIWPLPFRMRWAPVAVAVLVLAYVGGRWSGRDRLEAPSISNGLRNATTDFAPASVSQRPASGIGMRYVRLVYVPAHPEVQQVTVAGSFNNWKPDSTPMQRQNGIWSTILVLSPGSYEYMFVEDGDRWVTDPLAIETRYDGFGGFNAVLDVES